MATAAPAAADAAVSGKTTPPAAFTALDERYERLPLEQVWPSKTNPRTHFDDTYLGELAGSIAEKGVAQPILVRQVDAGSHKPMRFEIIAGECRYRASKIAQQTHIPALIRQYTDEQVLELQLIENIHRKDLTALEQAVGYRRLITQNPDKHSAATIAQRVGMSEAWVWDRLKLNDLVQEAKDILEQERMTIGHAILIARLKPEDQQRVIAVKAGGSYGSIAGGLWQHQNAGLEWDENDPENKGRKPGQYDEVKAVSVRELESWIKDHIRFDVAHAARAVPLVFEPVAAAVAEAEAKPGRGKKVVAITHDYRVADDARDESDRTYGSQSWQRADGLEKSKTCEHSLLGVVVAGHGQGDTLQVCVARDKCRVHFAEVVRAKEKAAKLRESGKSTQAAKVEKRTEQKWEIEARKRDEERARWNAVKADAVAAVISKIKPGKITDAVLRSVVAQLSMHTVSEKELVERLGGRVTAKTFVRAIAIIDVLENDHQRSQFLPVAKKYGVDLAKLEKELAAKAAAAAPAKKAS